MSRISLLIIFLCIRGSSGISTSSITLSGKIEEPPKQHHFTYVYNYIRQNVEGNYVNNPHDRGKETYGGISRKIHPSWYGWKYIDQAKPLKRHDRVENAEFWVQDFYLTLWCSEGFERITNRELALSLFDFRIHSSPRTVSKLTSRVLVELGYCPVEVGEDWITEDFNHVDPTEFILRLKIQRLILFNHLVLRDPDQMTFYKGWVSRIQNI